MFAPVLMALLFYAAAAPAWTSTFVGTVIAVGDGDTISVRHDRRTVRVRLFGIDCPELHQAFGRDAQRATSQLVLGREVSVRVHDYDRYDRAVGDVVLADGRVLNHELVHDGLAWWYRYHSGDRTLAALEAEAKAARRGLWKQPNPVPPWEFRRSAPRRERW